MVRAMAEIPCTYHVAVFVCCREAEKPYKYLDAEKVQDEFDERKAREENQKNRLSIVEEDTILEQRVSVRPSKPTVHEMPMTPSEQSTACLGEKDVIEEE